jgi:hypothetical protein
MYLHAERLLAKAGRQGAREGYRPPERSGGKRSAVIFRRKIMGRPLRRARAAPSARFGFLAVRGAREMLLRDGVEGRTQARWDGKRKTATLAKAREGTPSPRERSSSRARDVDLACLIFRPDVSQSPRQWRVSDVLTRWQTGREQRIPLVGTNTVRR